MIDANTNTLAGVLAALRAVHWSHWTSHWQAAGGPYYGDHLMLERLYNAVTEEIDTLAEKMVDMCGAASVDPVVQAHMMTRVLEAQQDADPIRRAYKVEMLLQSILATAFQRLEASRELSLGMNDFLAATANAHETALYLLNRRLNHGS